MEETIWLGNRPVATGRDHRLYYIHTDHLGTPRVITEPGSGRVVWQWRSGPFGTGQPNEDPSGTGRKFVYNLRFAGQYYDSETGTAYNGFRDYDPGLGRYVESDPLGLWGGVNSYAYVTDSPENLLDPYGLEGNSALESGVESILNFLKSKLLGEGAATVTEVGSGALEGGAAVGSTFRDIARYDYKFYKSTGVHPYPNYFGSMDWKKYKNFKQGWHRYVENKMNSCK